MIQRRCAMGLFHQSKRACMHTHTHTHTHIHTHTHTYIRRLGKGSSGDVLWAYYTSPHSKRAQTDPNGSRLALKIVPITLKSSDTEQVLTELRDLYRYLCVCICVCMCVCMYVFVCIYTNIHKRKIDFSKEKYHITLKSSDTEQVLTELRDLYRHLCVCKCVCVCIYIYIFIYIYIYIYI